MIKTKKFTKWVYFISGWSVICFVCFLFCSRLSTQVKLNLFGEKKKAVVTKVWIRKAYPRACYEFEINDIKYHGDAGYFPLDVAVGDSLYITYLPSDPNINMRLGDE